MVANVDPDPHPDDENHLDPEIDRSHSSDERELHDTRDQADPDDELESEEYEDEYDEDEAFDDDDYEESEESPPEFSLSQLSEAYASVIEQQTGVRPIVVTESEPQEDSDPESVPEVDDDQACPISPESIIESILFVGAPKDVKLNSRKIAAVLRDVSPKEVTKIVRELNAKYEAENAAYRIKSDGGVFEMILAPNLKEFHQDFFGRNKEATLTQAAIDVMAIVAYNQPTTKEQVEKVRGKPSGTVLAQLVRREILSLDSGEEDSKVKYYSTTDRFLDLFQLDDIRDLPQSHDVSDIAELAD